MAEGLARSMGGDTIDVFSTGSSPSGIVNSGAIQVMREKGIDISNHFSKSVETLPDIEFDVVVTMGCEDECPAIRATKRIEWKVPNPKGGPIEFFRQVRDIIEGYVEELLKSLEST